MAAPEPHCRRKLWTLYAGDALHVLPRLPAGLADCVVTDPPYSSGGLFRSDRSQTTRKKYVHTGQVDDRPDFAGDTRDQRGYLRWASLWLSDCLRLTKPGGACLVFCDWRQLPITTDALQAGGWVWRGIVPWDKTEGARPQKGRFKAQCEFVAWGSKGTMKYEGECLQGLFRHSPFGDEKTHIAQKPVGLLADLVKICPKGGTVLDPFVGSASTGIACLQSGRRFVGVEIEGPCLDLAARRLTAAEPFAGMGRMRV